MHHKIRRIALNTINKTPLEPFARKTYGLLIPSKGNEYDKQTFTVMKRLLNKNSNCLDVGAYRGEILREIFKIAPSGKHFAFEPVPENAEYLKKKFPKATIHQVALGSKKGQTTFTHVVGRAARSGIVQVDYPDSHQQVEKINVIIDTLDNIVPNKVKIGLLKIDVEGAELAVLKGAKKLLIKDRPLVVFEHEKIKADLYDTKPEHVYDLLANQVGMKIYLMSDFLKNGQHLTRSRFIKLVETGDEFYFMAK